MAGELVLITGANGHVGFKVVLFALEAGYHVRAAVRTQEKADKILNSPSIRALNPGKRLTFVFVPDLLREGAYIEPLEGVQYAIHVASPITNGISEDKYQAELIEPAIKGATNFLEAADKTPSLKRVVITSSIIAQMTWEEFFGSATDTVYNEKSRTANPTGPFGSEFEAYAASKIYALNASETWMKDRKPKFSLVNVHPAFVVGKDELATDTNDALRGSNGQLLNQILGNQALSPLPGVTIYLDDTALAHVKGLDENKIPNGQSLLTTSGGTNGTTWGDVVKIVAKHFPEAVKNGIFPNNAPIATKILKSDASVSENLLGYKFKPFEEQVINVVEHYLQLAGQPVA